MNSPKTFIGQKLRIEDMSCVDPGKAGFVCLKQIGGRLLMIDGLVMGPKTAQSIAELLIGDCKGTANLGEARCRMAVELEVTGAGSEMVEGSVGSFQRVTLMTPMIEFYQAKRR